MFMCEGDAAVAVHVLYWYSVLEHSCPILSYPLDIIACASSPQGRSRIPSQLCMQPESVTVCSARERRSVRTGFLLLCRHLMKRRPVGQEATRKNSSRVPHRPGQEKWSGTLHRWSSSSGCGRRWLPRVVSCIGSSSQLAVVCQCRAVTGKNAGPKSSATWWPLASRRWKEHGSARSWMLGT